MAGEQPEICEFTKENSALLEFGESSSEAIESVSEQSASPGQNSKKPLRERLKLLAKGDNLSSVMPDLIRHPATASLRRE